MARYLFICLRCKRQVEVERRIAERDVPPETVVEATDCNHEWKREISITTTVRGPDWGRKGRW